jgi:aerobic-type carbon monoxide dehydrogenase small subunit (CoxS/CutS family)
MPDTLTYELRVNGEALSVASSATATLLDVLRYQLGMTGSKRGCNQGVCGACTVLLDGAPVRGCLTLAANVGERAVTTIEGVSQDGTLSRVQQALLDAGAIQCGFCTPGVVMTLEAFLRDHPKPSADQVRHALSGNLCRCSGYVKIVEAAVAASGAAP